MRSARGGGALRDEVRFCPVPIRIALWHQQLPALPQLCWSGVLTQHFGWDNLHTLGRRKQYQRIEKKNQPRFMEGLCYAQEKSCVYLSSAAPGLAGSL